MPKNRSQIDAIRVATWNVNRKGASVLDALAGIVPDLHILTLQEVTIEKEGQFRECLRKMGLQYSYYSGRADVQGKRYGNIVASYWPLRPTELQYSREELPWPQLLARVSVLVDSRSIALITAHMPNGSQNGWEKIDTFKLAAVLVRQAEGSPCIVTGDFNEPRFALQDGRVVTWGQDQDRSGRFDYWDEWEFKGRTGTGTEWDSAVRWLFENRAEHGLRHAYWEVKGGGAMDVSHVTKGREPRRWFDHMFVSVDFRVKECRYLHELRAPGLSDHSALTATLVFDT